MESYFAALLDSELPFGPWVAAMLWAALFVANHWIAHLLKAANDTQKVIVVEDWNAVRGVSQPKHVVAQVLLAGVVIVLSASLGGWAFVFFAGGLIVAMACGVGLAVQGLWTSRAVAVPDAVTGSVGFSTTSAFRHMAHRAGGAAIGCLLMGLALAHLALLGGAFFLGSAANGYLRRARKAGARA